VAASTAKAPSSSRPRTTINLKEIATAPQQAVTPEAAPQLTDKPLQQNEVIKTWTTYAELQRSQVAEYQLLNREIVLDGTQVVLQLMNPFEEQLLQTLRTDLLAFLRTHLQNSQITIRGELLVPESKKMIYTNREKFDFLLEKYPQLKDWRDRLGLDADF
jgi:DNA polymerase-3 subunit gamma/tau